MSCYSLPLEGIHGPAHWRRVWRNGAELAARTGALVDVLELFALLHDSKRKNDGLDWEHGVRAAEFCRGLRQQGLLTLAPQRLELLLRACTFHTRGGEGEQDLTVLTCWDADRLDLYRIGIRPAPSRLCTAAARDKDVIASAMARSLLPPEAGFVW